MSKYQVRATNELGPIVWELETDGEYESTKVYPAEYMNPTEGTFAIIADDVVIGVQRPYSERRGEEIEAAVQQARRALEEAEAAAAAEANAQSAETN